uniref:Ig-like domain-containing protein n=1 Tax=Panagrolaimus sp. JU765 TaxID=591449 RepID=A0AC34PUZ6_9BILA
MSELGGEAWGGTNKNAPIIDEPQNSTVVKGHSAQFRCHISNLNNAVNPVFRWLKETNLPASATVLTIRNKTFTILDQQANSTVTYNTKRSKVYSNTLFLPSVTEHESGRYICVITSVDGYVGYRTAQLNVILPDSQSPPLHSFVSTIILVIGIGFVLLVASAIAWLRCSTSGPEKSSTQSKSTCSTGSDCYPINFNISTGLTKNTLISSGLQSTVPPPPPPRIPAPEAPTTSLLQKNYLFSVHGTPTGSPLLQQDRRLRAPASATLDRRYRPQPQQMLHRTFAEDEMSRLSSNIYDSGTPLPPPNSVLLSSSSHIYCSTSPKQTRQKRAIDPRTGYGIDDNYLTMNYRDQPVFPTSSPRW